MKKLFLLLVAVFALTVSVAAQNRTVTGTVLSDQDDEPLTGASVMPVGLQTGVVTDIDGNFSISIPESVKTLKVSYIGFATVEVPVKPHMVIRLKSENVLDNVVVTGYTEKKLGSIVGNVSVVTAEKIGNTPATNFVDALQGQVAGLSILSSSGDPSSVQNEIRIRGVNSILLSNSPLFILDGAPVTQTVFNTLNPNDIESITVLKDAASTAIYGTRASNGVIVITSKKGKYGQAATVSIRASAGWSQMVKDQTKMMNAKQYAKFRELVQAPLSAEALYAVNELGINTNWRNEIFDGHAPTYKMEASVTGGSDSFTYYIGLSHYDQQGIIDQSGMYRDVLRMNIASRVNSWFRMGLQTNIGYTKYQTNNESNAIYSGSGLYTANPMIFIRKAMPFDSPRYYYIDENGKAVYGEKALYLHFTGMPTPEYFRNNRSVWRNRLTVNANVYEQITPIKGLNIRAQQAVDAYDSRLKNWNYPTSDFVTPMGDPWIVSSPDGAAQQSFSRYYSFTYTNTATYTKNFNEKHDMTIVLGQESILSKSESFGIFEEGYKLKEMMFLGQGSVPVPTANLSQGESRSVINSFFATGSYSFMDRYFLDASIRRDGSSRFTSSDRWGTFWSVGAMWNIKNEKFARSANWLNDLRFRVSYGTTGNGGVGDYEYQGLVGTSSSTYNGGTILGVRQVPLPKLTWERVKAFDIGFAGKVLDRLSFDVDFYQKRTTDMLLNIPWSLTTGFSGGLGNIGNMTNTGVDIDLKADVFSNKDWYVGIRANMGYNRNKVTKLFQDQDAYTLEGTGLRLEVGHDSGEYYMVRFAGVDPRDGKQLWYTREGNLTKKYNEERDAVMTGKSQFSPIHGGFGAEVRWKGLSIAADFSWAGKKYMLNNDRYFIENTNTATDFNQMTSMLNVWTTPGQITDIPKVGEAIQFDTHMLENASFLRLKKVTVMYSLPGNWVRSLKLQNIALHFTGRNLWTVTKYTGYDPEPETNVVAFFYPNTRQYEFGLEVSF